MHDLVRLYAGELAQGDGDQVVRAARRRLFDYFLHTARHADELIMPHRYRIPLPGTTAVPTPFTDHDGALAWLYAECANAVALCRLDAPDLDTAKWQLAFLFRGFFFLTKRNHEWIESHELALAAAIRLGDRRAEAMTRNNLGVALHERGDDDAALAQYEIANRLFTEVDDPHGVSNTLAQQAVIRRSRREFGEGFRLGTEALAFYREAGSLRNAAITLRTIGRTELEAGRLADAEQHLTESLEHCRSLGRGMDMDTARAYNALGEVLLRLGRHNEAERSHRSAVKASKSCGSRFEEALAMRGLGEVARAKDDRAVAETHFQNAVEVLDELGSPLAAEVRADLVALDQDGSGQLPG
jgi:tetratricopeptide (TPR) repeat protein